MAEKKFRPNLDGRVYDVLTCHQGDVSAIWQAAQIAYPLRLTVRDQGNANAPIEEITLIPYGVAWEGGDRSQSDGNEVVVRARVADRTLYVTDPVIGFCWDQNRGSGLLNVVRAP